MRFIKTTVAQADALRKKANWSRLGRVTSGSGRSSERRTGRPDAQRHRAARGQRLEPQSRLGTSRARGALLAVPQ